MPSRGWGGSVRDGAAPADVRLRECLGLDGAPADRARGPGARPFRAAHQDAQRLLHGAPGNYNC